jgi:hypothetical protein
MRVFRRGALIEFESLRPDHVNLFPINKFDRVEGLGYELGDELHMGKHVEVNITRRIDTVGIGLQLKGDKCVRARLFILLAVVRRAEVEWRRENNVQSRSRRRVDSVRKRPSTTAL